jgi:circadian clock protein KaiB
MMGENVLKLFVTGKTRRARQAVRNLRSIYETASLSSSFDMLVIDVLENPDQAEAERILATPTLLATSEQGTTRIIGDLSNTEEVLRIIGAHTGPGEQAEGRDEQ